MDASGPGLAGGRGGLGAAIAVKSLLCRTTDPGGGDDVRVFSIDFFPAHVFRAKTIYTFLWGKIQNFFC